MDLEQYNFKRFQDGLSDILKNPWKSPLYIQDTIPTFPEENDEDRPVHNLIMLQFIDKRLLRPYYSTVGYLLLNKVYFLKYILETYSTKADFVAMFEGPSRLTFNEIYKAFNGMSPTNASFLLDRIGCPVSVYTRLKESLEKKEETKFAEAIDECDISNILPALKYILFVKQQVKELNSPEPQGKEGTNMDFETAKQKLLYELETDMTEKHGISPNSQLKQESMAFIGELLKLTNNPNELLESFYPPLFCQYCQMKKGGGLNDSDVKAFEYIFHQPAFEEQYERFMKLWETGELEGMFTKRSEEDSQNEDGSKEGFDSVAANKKEQQSTPQIEEPASVEPQPEQLSAADYDQTPRPKFTPEQRKTIKNFYIRPNYFKDTSQKEDTPRKANDHCTITNEKFYKIDAKDRAKKFKAFIKMLAMEGCIDPTNEAMQLCAYAFTGIGFKYPFQPGYAKWRQEKVDILLFICTKFFKKNNDFSVNYDTALRAFQVTAEGNRNARAKKIKNSRFDAEFSKLFPELKQSDSTDPSQS